MKIRFQKVRDNAVLPFAATEMSGGLDITAAHIEHISEKEVLVYTGHRMQPVTGHEVRGLNSYPTKLNYRIRFSARSSFTKYNWVLQNSPCLGDADFAGEYRLRFRAIPTNIISEVDASMAVTASVLTYDDFPYKVGDRVAQMWIEEIIPIEFEEGELPNHTDRKGGFGSTGMDNTEKDIVESNQLEIDFEDGC